MLIAREITLTKSPCLIIKSDYTAIENWIKISYSLIGKHRVDLFRFVPLAAENNTRFHHSLPVPLSVVGGPIPWLPGSFSVLPSYAPQCSISQREKIRGQIMLPWALALWIITENYDWFSRVAPAHPLPLPRLFFPAKASALHPPPSSHSQTHEQ